MPIIKISRLKKDFGRVTAVRGINFEIAKGEVVGLLGPNGAGKTTTIHMILGLIEPSAGQIKIFGKDIAKEREEILQKVNFSSAYVQMPYNLTVGEVLVFFARLYNVPNPKNKAAELIDQFDLRQFKNTRAGRLSSGEQTRLNLAKAMVNNPEILFLDEPTASLDPAAASRVRQLLKKLHTQQGLTILYTSHNMSEIEQMVKRVIFIHQGKIIARGTPKEIARRRGQGNLETAFIELAKRKGGR